jgi:hypothetical protein
MGILGFVAIAGFFLFTEHKAHVLGILPYSLGYLSADASLHAHGITMTQDEPGEHEHHHEKERQS